ncbi:MAG TPA: histidine kinase [Pseudonocardiaceae bacterium]|nr:histidine kinase [Pseudonocardiaceae bacterium]
MTDQTPIFGILGRRPITAIRKARWAAFLLLMLSFHLYPISDLVHRHLPAGTVALVLVLEAGAAALWVRTMWLALATTAPFPVIRPWLAAVAVSNVMLALVLGGNYKGMLIYLSIACAVSLPPRWTLPALVACTGVALAAEFRNTRYLALAPGDRPNEIVTALCLVFFLGLMMWFYRRVMTLILELRTARAELARLAVTEERLRFARDLHDLLGHSLTTIALKSQVARRLATPDSPVAREVGDIESVAQQALAEVREAVTGYRGRSLADELDAARSTLTAAGIDVTVRLDGTVLPAPLDALLGWVVREGTTNVLRHSGARSCEFRLHRDATGVCLDVCDDGVGPNGGPPGNGLAGLAERVSGAGGRLDSGPAPHRGFHLAARLPPAVGGDT